MDGRGAREGAERDFPGPEGERRRREPGGQLRPAP